jgi:hypothetical protein
MVSQDLVGLSYGETFVFGVSHSLLTYLFLGSAVHPPPQPLHGGCFSLTKVWLGLYLPSSGMLPELFYAAQSLAFVQGIEDQNIIGSKRVDNTHISCLVFGFFLFHFHDVVFTMGLLLGAHPSRNFRFL